MSLINQMLQDLEARRSDVAGADSYSQQIRAVPEHRRIHPAWGIALVSALVSVGLVAWILLRPAAQSVVPASPHLPLKFDTGLRVAPPAIASPPSHLAASGMDEQATEKLSESAQDFRTATAALAPVASAEQTPVPSQPARTEPPKLAAADTIPVHEPQKVRTPTDLPAQEKVIAPVNAKLAPATVPGPLPSSASPKHVKELLPQQRAENEYRNALIPMQQGKMQEAINGMEQALQIDPRHVGARRALIGALLEEKRLDDALQSAREGLQLDAAQPDLAMILARLQLDKGELKPAIDTLKRTLPYGAERGDYQAFLAALLQRDESHKQAIEHYLLALQKAPQNGIWWMGLGISLQASHRMQEAQEAYQRAKATNSLAPELLAFVDSRLAQVRR